MYCSQNRALQPLLDTLCIQQSNSNTGQIILYSTLLIGHTQHPGYMCMSAWPFVSKQLLKSNRQDKVIIRLQGISVGEFQLGNIWFCNRGLFQLSRPVCPTQGVPYKKITQDTGRPVLN